MKQTNKLNITEEHVRNVKEWFHHFVDTFTSGDDELKKNALLKEAHTRRVCAECAALGKSLDLTDQGMRLIEIAALLHDIGRFEQYRRYRTFVDADSTNHAELGVVILKEQQVLDPLDDHSRNLIFNIILYHNRPTLPPEESELCLHFTRMLRDADKLDIWRIMTDHFQLMKKGVRDGAIELGLPDTTGFSDAIYIDLMAGHIVSVNHLTNLNDFKLLQVGWVYDINFSHTFVVLHERRYLETIQEVLPNTEKIDAIFKKAYKYIEEHWRSA